MFHISNYYCLRAVRLWRNPTSTGLVHLRCSPRMSCDIYIYIYINVPHSELLSFRKNHLCRANSCTCSDGKAVTGADCDKHKAAACRKRRSNGMVTSRKVPRSRWGRAQLCLYIYIYIYIYMYTHFRVYVTKAESRAWWERAKEEAVQKLVNMYVFEGLGDANDANDAE